MRSLPKVGLGGFAEAVDGEGAALAEVHLVGVHLEDLLLGEARFELEGDHDFGDLALDSFLSGVRKKPRASCWVRWSRRSSHMLREDVVDAALDGRP